MMGAGKYVIAVLARGWVLVGEVEDHTSEVMVLSRGFVVRRWGTSKGLFEIEDGPTSATQLDPFSCRKHVRPLYYSEVDDTAWAKVFDKQFRKK